MLLKRVGHTPNPLGDIAGGFFISGVWMTMRWDELELETLAVRAGIHRSQFNEHSEAMYLTSSFVFRNAAEAAARFSGTDGGMVYSRYTNPTVTAMEERLAALEARKAASPRLPACRPSSDA
jgi:cystathionine beta-lyase/cystathionine gamma-synthase